MSFTNSPYFSTYTSFKLPVANTISFNPSFKTVEAGMINLVPSKIMVNGQEELHSFTRPPIHGQYLQSGANVVLRGMYVWEKSVGTVYYFAVAGTSVYTSTDTKTWTAVTTLLTNVSTPVRFTEFIDDVNTKKLIMVDGVEGYVFTSNAAGTKITDVDFPSPHIPFPVVIDGYLFLAKSGTGDIYNSDLNHPENWTAGSFISSELYPDDVQAIVKVNNYLLAIGTQGCEYFYDAANPTASPLQRQDGASLPFGTEFPNSIAVNKNTVVMLAGSAEGEPVFKYIEDFKHKDIPSSSFVVYNLGTEIAGIASITNLPQAAYVRGCFLRINGDLIYVFSGNGQVLSGHGYVTEAKTFCYSFNTNMWFTWNSENTQGCFPVCFSAPATTNKITNYVGGTFYNSTGQWYAYFGKMEYSKSDGPLANFDPNVATDEFAMSNGGSSLYKSPYNVYLTTEKFDGGTPNWKIMNRVVVDAINAPNTTTSFHSITVMDYDYTNSGVAASSLVYGQNPLIEFRQLGAFKKRAIQYTYGGTDFLHIRGIECFINRGST